MIRSCLVLIGMLALAAPALSAVDDALQGRWRGAVQGTNGEALELEIELRDADDGFIAGARGGDFVLPEMSFAATARRGVFEGRGDRGIMGLLGIAQRVGPEVGEPLVWARQRADGGLVIYRLAVATDGRFALDRLALSGDGDRLDVQLSRRSESDDRQLASGLLERAP